MVHPQHRVLLDIAENVEIINTIMGMEHLEVSKISFRSMEEISISEQLCKYEVVVKLYNSLFGMNFKTTSMNVMEKVPSFRLQNEIFTSFLDE